MQNAAKLGRVVASPPFFNLRGVGVDVFVLCLWLKVTLHALQYMFASFIDGMCCITIFAYFPVKTHYPRPEKSICGLSICSVFLICLYHNYWWCLLGLLFFPSSQYTHPLFSSLKQAMTPNPRAETAAMVSKEWLKHINWCLKCSACRNSQDAMKCR